MFCFFSAPADYRNSGWFFIDWSWKAEADELNISQAAIQFLMSSGQKDAFSPQSQTDPHINPFWPLDSLSVSFGLCQ